MPDQYTLDNQTSDQDWNEQDDSDVYATLERDGILTGQRCG